jgi:hypothetical protein
MAKTFKLILGAYKRNQCLGCLYHKKAAKICNNVQKSANAMNSDQSQLQLEMNNNFLKNE